MHTGIIEPDTRPGQNHDDVTWVWLSWSELPTDQGRAGWRRLRAHPRPTGGAAATGTMPHRPGQDRVNATSSRSRLARG